MQRYIIFFITVKALHGLSSFSANHQELICTCSIGYLSDLFAATVSMDEVGLKFDKYLMLHVQI